MLRMRLLALSLSFAMAATGCSAAYADQPGGRVAIAAPRTALALAPERIRAPFDVTLLAEDGSALSTFAQNGRYYVLGEAGSRYTIRVTNPTPRRVEAVVSVDGLDVIDGEGGDLAKRGYIVPPYGDLRIEGFRTSQSDVATFRFSAVGASYAGRKGKARNVGVIAVALFEEQAAQELVQEQIATREPTDEGRRRDAAKDDYDYRSDLAPPSTTSRGVPAAPSKAKRMEPAAEPSVPAAGATDRAGALRPAPPPPVRRRPPISEAEADEACCAPTPQPQPRRQERLGLGTEFGEQRYSAASYTRFVRAPGKPIAIAELRYNDRAGLGALGIAVAPAPDDNEIMLRETADPFPGDRFARPPGR
ncbi:MAG: hypothetical protein R3B48_17995 [Kofleriaceae bacterium]